MADQEPITVISVLFFGIVPDLAYETLTLKIARVFSPQIIAKGAQFV
jgi:hypothetical protein